MKVKYFLVLFLLLIFSAFALQDGVKVNAGTAKSSADAEDINTGKKSENIIETDEDIKEGEFEYEGSVYKITNEKKHRVELVKSRLLKEYDNKCYEQEAYVYDGDVKYSVYSIGYKAFSEDGIKAKVQVKLPSTVRGVRSEKLNERSNYAKDRVRRGTGEVCKYDMGT